MKWHLWPIFLTVIIWSNMNYFTYSTKIKQNVGRDSILCIRNSLVAFTEWMPPMNLSKLDKECVFKKVNVVTFDFLSKKTGVSSPLQSSRSRSLVQACHVCRWWPGRGRRRTWCCERAFSGCQCRSLCSIVWCMAQCVRLSCGNTTGTLSSYLSL